MSINSLTQTQFSGIFYYLQDSDLKVLGCTSKKMHALVTEELKARDRKMEQLLASGFVITRTFKIQHAVEARLFPIGDEHGNEDCIRDRSALIGFLSRRAPVILLIEGVPSMSPRDIFQTKSTTPSGKSFYWIQPLAIEPAFKANIHAIGWDDLTDQKMRSLIVLLQETIQKRRSIKAQLLMEAAHLSPLLPAELRTPRIWEKLGYKGNEPLSLSKNPLLYIKEVNRFIVKFTNQVYRFVNENLEEIKTNQKNLFYSYKNYATLYCKLNPLDKELEKTHKELVRQSNEFIRSEFPNRTNSAASTLQKVDTYRLDLGIGEHYVVLLSGSDHLEARKNNAEYDLSALYKELKQHKAAILLPKAVMPFYQGHSFPKAAENK